MTTKNRIVMPAMGTNYATEDGYITERLRAYYEQRAKWGVGLIITEFTCVQSPIGKGALFQLGIDDDRFIPGLSELVQAVKRHGARLAMQLHHAGMETTEQITGRQPVGPSSVRGWMRRIARELTTNEIAQIVVCFAKAAERAKKAGFDGVEIHAAHHYLLAQFLSRAWNKREDGYGGKLESRARFLLETIEAVRKAVGSDFPVWCRINGAEYGNENGLTLDEAKKVAQMAEGVGADAIHVSAFGGGSQALRGITVREAGALVNLAEGIKKVVDIPVITVGRIGPILAEDILRKGKADFVAMGRALIADPQLPEKLSLGGLKDIRPCINCLECVERLTFAHVPIECSVNAAAGRERESQVEPTTKPKTVMVIGGGPAGMEAARVAASRGHKVLLYERATRLGGQLLLASVPPLKDDINAFTDYLVAQMSELGVDVQLGQYVTPDIIQQVQPDTVIIATGGTPLVPDIPGIARHQVVTAHDILADKVKAKNTVAVIGGGMVGCETADFLSSKGKKVTIVEVLGKLAQDMMPVLRRALLDRLTEKGVTILTGTKVEEVIDSGLIIRDKDEKVRKLDVETVVLAIGAKSCQVTAKALKGKAPEIYVIGDCLEPRRIPEAVSEGFRVALGI